MTPPRHRCPWFWGGFTFGLALGLWCIHTGFSTHDTRPVSLTHLGHP
jgi:hypothetical protein